MSSHYSPQSQTQVAASGAARAVPPSSQSNAPPQKGLPFRKMYQLRERVSKAMTRLAQAKTLVANARMTSTHSLEALEKLESDLRFKSAELVSLQKKLAPMEANFSKFHAEQDGITRRKAASNKLPPAKRLKTEDSDYMGTKKAPLEQTPIVTGPMINTATLDVPLYPEECILTADECQYDHLERLRRQYARPFELFCEEMESIGDSCLTGICLALPDMPWSIAVSRLAFLFKTTLDSHGSDIALSDVRYLSTGTTIGCEQHTRYIGLAELMIIKDWRDFMHWAHHHSHHQLGKLVNDEGVGLVFPVHKSYGHILVHKYEDASFVEVDTLLQIPSTYQSNEVQQILQNLPTWTEISFTGVLSSIFWYARRRNAPFLASQFHNWNARFDHRSPRYQCPFCHGFDNYFDPKESLVETITDYDNLYEALRHMLLTHTRVPVVRKVRFLFEETQECPTICDAWKIFLPEDHDAAIASLAKGEVPQVVSHLCSNGTIADETVCAGNKSVAPRLCSTWMEGGKG
ncbi:hypothetical protein F5Y09DRAFT_335200 [Xylaria sp. FL1042]|nr:hypothetical protein F5Y09DRAFT_335200 [Xylaria sp. FL1042]